MEEQDRSHRCSVSVVGDSDVGKTLLVRRIAQENMAPMVPRGSSLQEGTMTESTIGADFHTIRFPHTELFLWDTAGMERFATITRSYIASSDGIILVYSVDNPLSLVHAQDAWRSVIERYQKDPPNALWPARIVLWGNKNDKPAHSATVERAREWAMEEGLFHVQTCSAKTGEGVWSGLERFVQHLAIHRMIEHRPAQAPPLPFMASSSSSSASSCC